MSPLRIYFDTHRHAMGDSWHGRPFYLCAECFESNELYGLVQCLETLSLYRAALTLPLRNKKKKKNKQKNCILYKLS